jgi:hypothetical protein
MGEPSVTASIVAPRRLDTVHPVLVFFMRECLATVNPRRGRAVRRQRSERCTIVLAAYKACGAVNHSIRRYAAPWHMYVPRQRSFGTTSTSTGRV